MSLFKIISPCVFSMIGLCSIARGAGAVILFPITIPGGSEGSLPSDFAAGQAVTQEELSNGTNRALLYSNPQGSNSPTIVDLTPTGAGFSNAFATATDGAQQVGAASASTSSPAQAYLWSGSSASGVNLNPTGLAQINASFANAVGGIEQAGYGGAGSVTHAIVWKGNAASAVDLNPAQMKSSIADGTDGIQQVGEFGGFSTSNDGDGEHAALWSGTAASGIDLNPSGFVDSNATACSPGVQVGYGGLVTGGNYSSQALLWRGTNTAVDLNPSGFTYSMAYGTNGSLEVGYGAAPGYVGGAALAWAGSASSYTNLQTLLPTSGTWTSSKAYTVDSFGVISGSANGTYGGYTGQFAVEWVLSAF